MTAEHVDVLAKLVGRNVRRHRLRLGWTQAELARRAGLNRSYVGGVERGMRNLRLSTLAALAAALGVKPAELLMPEAGRDGSESEAAP